VTPADLAPRLCWLPCETCGTTGIDGSTFVGATWLEPSQAEPCPSCNGIGWLASPAVLEAMADAIYEDQRSNRLGKHSFQSGSWNQVSNCYGARDDYLSQARAAWEAQARLELEGER
jgi:hypothetical protein